MAHKALELGCRGELEIRRNELKKPKVLQGGAQRNRIQVKIQTIKFAFLCSQVELWSELEI